MTKIVFFDAAGTLFYLPRGVGWHYRAVAERHGCSLSEQVLSDSFGAVWKGMPARAVIGTPRLDDDKGWWRDLVNRVLDQCRVPAAKLDRTAYFEELYREFTLPGIWELFPEVRETLSALRPHFRLGIISNFDGRLRRILKHLELSAAFDPVVISSEVGADKPHPLVFQHALAQAAVEPHEALHVGDDPVRDWQGAAAAGLETFQLDRPANSLRELVARLRAPCAS